MDAPFDATLTAEGTSGFPRDDAPPVVDAPRSTGPVVAGQVGPPPAAVLTHFEVDVHATMAASATHFLLSSSLRVEATRKDGCGDPAVFTATHEFAVPRLVV